MLGATSVNVRRIRRGIVQANIFYFLFVALLPTCGLLFYFRLLFDLRFFCFILLFYFIGFFPWIFSRCTLDFLLDRIQSRRTSWLADLKARPTAAVCPGAR